MHAIYAHFEIHGNFQARNCSPSIHQTFNMLTEEEEEEEEEALQPGLEKSLSCSFPSLRTDVRAAED